MMLGGRGGPRGGVASGGTAALLLLLCLAVTAPAQAQDIDRQIRANRARLDSIRQEREQLEAELGRLRGRAHDIAGELFNIERQKSATNRLVNELDRQMRGMGASLDTVTLDLALTEDALAEKRAILHRRLADIYKRGPLWTFQVMLSAESFGDLLSRYKYLYLVSRQDRSLVGAVDTLRRRIASQRRQLLRLQNELAARRDERSEELDRYVTLERRHQRSLSETRASERAAARRLETLSRDAERLNQLIAALERARRAAASAPGTPTISTRDLGKLDWPVTGDLLYRFGPYRLPNNTTVVRQGIGIGVPPGTPVRAVAGGVVRMAEPYGTYGPSVILDHGGGFYTLYLYLSQVDLQLGQRVSPGDVVGLSGGQNSDEGPHVEFQVRGEGSIALDPLNWLKSRR
ncbi:MAG: peptidoglycan DD-metalloendopeptidase family protein [Gemmatimonadetes bacterium]|nr:peptidoglycan DD-metalloendopeptidase family protein [Gemmatimonadota bacterium]